MGSTSPDGSYGIGDEITLYVAFDRAVELDTTGGIPTLLLKTGSTDRGATYVSGSGTDTLLFVYRVQENDRSADLDYVSYTALRPNGATIRSAAGDAAALELPEPGSAGSIAGRHDLAVDGDRPSVWSISAPESDYYVAGQNLDFVVRYTEPVVVSGGTPRLRVTLDTGGTVDASYVSGSGTDSLLFRYVLREGDVDENGVSLGTTVELAGAGIQDPAGNDADTRLRGAGDTLGVRVDAVVPQVDGVEGPAAGRYRPGESLSFTVKTSEPVFAETGGGTPRLVLEVGDDTVYAGYAQSSGPDELVFEHAIQNGEVDEDGIAVTGLEANGGSLHDGAGNEMDLRLAGVGDTSGVLVGPTPGYLRFEVAEYRATEGASYATLAVTRVGGLDGEVSARYGTSGGTATPGLDYGPASGTLTFSPGERRQTFRLELGNDLFEEPDETIGLWLESTRLDPEGPSTATLTVADNDGRAGLRDDAYTVPADLTLTVRRPGVLRNDAYEPGTLRARLTDGPEHGTLLFAADGSFTYRPHKGLTGTDSFGYEAIDASGEPHPASVSIRVVSGGDRDCTIVGTSGDDVLAGTSRRDVICAGEGDDTVSALGGGDVVYGGGGDDAISGGAGDDRLYGGPGTDALGGGPGENRLYQDPPRGTRT